MFKDRYDAAHQLAEKLTEYKDQQDVVILAIPRGALEIGSVLAQELHAPLDVIFAKKIGAPGNPELAIGTVSMHDVLLGFQYQDNQQLKPYIQDQVSQLRTLLKERIAKYRGGKPAYTLQGKTVILVDDGVATGHTLRHAIMLIKKQHPQKIIVAIPVGPQHTVDQLKKQVDEVICLLTPSSFLGIGQFYQSFPQVEDKQAIELLKKANK